MGLPGIESCQREKASDESGGSVHFVAQRLQIDPLLRRLSLLTLHQLDTHA
ncbi:hypothetical protein D3C87_1392370 [compost metagenome]